MLGCKRSVLLFIVFIIIISAKTQTLEKDANANFKDFYLNLALRQYLDLQSRDSNNLLYNYRIGYCYLNLNLNRSLALNYLLKAYENNFQEPTILLDLGMAYFYSNQFDKAIEKLNEFKAFEQKNKILIQLADDYLRYATNAGSFINQPVNVSFVNLGERINSEESDYNPYYNDEEKMIVFTTDRKYNSEFKININNVYYSSFSKDEWERCKSAGSRINTMEDEILTGMAENYKYIFVQLRRFDAFNDVYMVDMNGSKFGDPVSLGSNVNDKSLESGVTLSKSGDTLIFASDRSGGFGGLDLYITFRLPDGSWGNAINLGSTINTEYDEDFPHFEDNSKTLYFASKGYNSMGGYDLFKSYFNSNSGEFDKPVNLGFPVNSVYDDKTISFSKDKRYAYKAAISEEGFGGYDIYQLIFHDQKQVFSIFKGKVTIQGTDSVSDFLTPHNDLWIEVYAEKESLFGKYKIDSRTGEYLIALPPGRYFAILKHEFFQGQKEPFIIPEMNSNRFIIQRNITFSLNK